MADELWARVPQTARSIQCCRSFF